MATLSPDERRLLALFEQMKPKGDLRPPGRLLLVHFLHNSEKKVNVRTERVVDVLAHLQRKGYVESNNAKRLSTLSFRLTEKALRELGY